MASLCLESSGTAYKCHKYCLFASHHSHTYWPCRLLITGPLCIGNDRCLSLHDAADAWKQQGVHGAIWRYTNIVGIWSCPWQSFRATLGWNFGADFGKALELTSCRAAHLEALQLTLARLTYCCVRCGFGVASEWFWWSSGEPLLVSIALDFA